MVWWSKPARPAKCTSSATLAGYGAEAINPYLAFETIEDMLPELAEEVSRDEAVKRYIKAINKGMLKVMSKMGISTYQSYCGAQIFDAVGLKQAFVDSTSPAPPHRSKASGLPKSQPKPLSAIGLPFPMRRFTGMRSTSAANMPSVSAASHMSGDLK